MTDWGAVLPAIAVWFVLMGIILKSMSATAMKKRVANAVREWIDGNDRKDDQYSQPRQDSVTSWIRVNDEFVQIIAVDPGGSSRNIATIPAPSTMPSEDVTKAVYRYMDQESVE